MLNKKSFARLLLLAVGSLAGQACSLPPPKVTGTGAGAAPGDLCASVGSGGTASGNGGTVGGQGGTVAGGAGGASAGGAGGGSEIAADASGSGVDTIITPVSCSATNAVAIDYAQGYTPDPLLQGVVQTTVNNMSLADEAAQMRGIAITPFNTPTYDIERSMDTGTIRGFQYRDASRGMDLGEDFAGVYPTAAVVAGSHVGYSTAFPVSMARGAAFDLDLEAAVGEAIGDEMQAAAQTVLLAPCMNLLRNPLWGRAQETYGEDSFQIGRLASAMTIGIQKHVLADAKHFMAYDVEAQRASNESDMDEQTLRETFGRHFRMVVQDGGVGSVMASYNLVNGKKATQNAHMLTDLLRTDFGFKGFVLSDWWAMPNKDPKTDAGTLKATAVEAVKAGLDVELPWGINFGQLENLASTANSGLTKGDLDTSVKRILEQKFRFNSQNLKGAVGLGSPITRYVNSRIMCDGPHIDLAEKAALESMVLLKNDQNTLPIPSTVTKVAVLGGAVRYHVTDGASMNGDSTRTINYDTDVVTGDLGSSRVFPDPAKSHGPFDGIDMSKPDGVTVVHGNTIDVAQDADFIVVVAGLTPFDEGEEYTGAADRKSLALDAKADGAASTLQNDLINAAVALHKPMVVVLEGGSVIDMPWLSNVPAVVMAWYPGQVGGLALGKLLWGNVNGTAYNFSGKLPLTWSALGDYPPFGGSGTVQFQYYAGYTWFDHNNITPIFPYGYGLSYTSFQYKNLQLGCSDMSKGAVLPVVVNVANTGSVAGDETVMVFVSYPNSKASRRPLKELRGFQRVTLAAGEEKQVTIPIRLADLDYFQMDSATGNTGKWVVETGDIKIMVGGSSTNLPLSATVPVTGY
ncbi:MAG TPA: glycoside hydrolase family 3 N-terminal domain-containing protein [Polyangia bacterium]|jgi:beta-glucosidase